MSRKWYGAASVAVLAAMAWPAQALAQSGDEEIVVTAQKRTQRLQDVPIVVTAVGKELLQDTGVKDVKDLMQVTPGLIVNSTNSESTTTARIRGVGTVGDNAGLESSVGIVIDGIYRPRAGTGIGDLGELERVEILKGPQGTLFGKNTSAGVINVITAAPDYEFGAEGVLTFGNYGAREASASVTGKLSEGVAGRLYFAARQRDGFYDIVTGPGPRTEKFDNDRQYWTARGQLLIEPSEDFSLRIIADYTDRDETCCSATTFLRGPTGPLVDLANGQPSSQNPVTPDERIGWSNRSGQGHVKDMGLSMEANWDVDWGTVTSITGIRNWKSEAGQESDFTTADLLFRRDDGQYFTEFNQISQEVRLAGEFDDINWLVGAFYTHETLDQSSPLYFGEDLERYFSLLFSGGATTGILPVFTGLPTGSILPYGLALHDTYEQTTDTIALFTNNTWEVTDEFEITVGLRYTHETKEVDAHYTNGPGQGASCAASRANRDAIANIIGPVGAARYLATICTTFNDPAFNDVRTRQEVSNDELTGTLKLAYKFDEDVMVYASYARGYKSGGFNLDRARFGDPTVNSSVNPDTFFDPEFVDSYELGAKTRFFDGDVTLNVTAFHQEFEDFQLNTFTGISYIVASIPVVKSTGVDTDITWRTPIEGLTLQGGVTYADTRYGNFEVDPTSGVSDRLPGARLNYAPLWSGTMAATYETDLNESLALHANVSARYSDAYNTGSNLDPIKMQDSYWNLSARVGVGGIDDNWRVELWGANLLDETISNVIFDATLQTGTYGTILAPPRTYGVTLRLTY